MALNPINTSIVATALVSISTDLHADSTSTAALISLLYLACAIAQPIMGKLCDVLGPRRVALSGMILVAIAGLLGTFAPSIEFLLVSRVLIGVGTSAIYPATLSLIRNRSEQTGVAVPPRVLAAVAIVAQACTALGLPLGGVLVGLAGWRAVFLVNVPAVALAFVLTLLWIPVDGQRLVRANRAVFREVDPVGIVLFSLTMAGLVWFLSDLAHPLWWLLPVLVVVGTALWFWERRQVTPFINVTMLGRNAPLVRTYLRNIGVSLALYVVLFGLGQWMEHDAGLPPSVAGLLLLPIAAVGALASAVAGRRVRPRFDALTVAIALLAGALLLILMRMDAFVVFVLAATVFVAITAGVGATSNQAAMYRQTPPDDLAVAAGLFRTTTYVGGIVAASLIGWAYADGATLAGVQTIGWVLAPLAVILLAFGVFDRSLRR